MSGILLTFSDLALGVTFQETLDSAGARVIWDQGARCETSLDNYDCVLLSGDELGTDLTSEVERWRQRTPIPGLVVCAQSPRVFKECQRLRLTTVAPDVTAHELVRDIRHAIKYRLSGELSMRMALQVVGMHPVGGHEENAIRVITNLDQADLRVVREALQYHGATYATPNSLIELLRTHRALQIPDLELLRKVDGAKTVRTLLRAGPTDVWRAARVLWGLVSVGAITLTEGPADLTTPTRRLVGMARLHLQARANRLTQATFYDVLEILPIANNDEIVRASTQLAAIFSPDCFEGLDLGDLRRYVEPLWGHIVKARNTLLDVVERRKYNDWIMENRAKIKSEWLHEGSTPEETMRAYRDGQAALKSGDVHRAVSMMATAARLHPGHPVFETTLCWARYRAKLSGGAVQPNVVRKERGEAEQAVLGHRPFPQSLLPLAMLCAADGDPASAEWYAKQALSIDPQYAPAQALLGRLSG